MKRLVVFSHKLFRQTNQGLQTTGGFTIQMDALAPYFKEVILCIPIIKDVDFLGTSITAENISFHPIPPFQGRSDFVRVIPRIQRVITNALLKSDLALIILPSYLGSLASILCQRKGFPLFHWVVGNPEQSVESHRNNPLNYWFANHVTKHISTYMIKRLTRDVLTFYNGWIFFDQGKSYHYTRISSSIHRKDLYIKDSESFSDHSLNLLFVGRLSPEKGVSVLLDAFAELNKDFRQAKLHIVGSGLIIDDLLDQVKELSIIDHVTFHGFIPQGEELLNLYRQSDILIIPSIMDQTPKVILEGMSQSLPVIASRVGGIPTMIQDGVNGLLIPPNQPNEIVKTCKRILTDNELRRVLIREGLQFAQSHTIESETEAMMTLVNAYIDRQP